jgi:endonuclease-3 related protein
VAKESLSQRLQRIYHQLQNACGPQHWWPADEPFEVMVGAILTQSAAWVNVEKAIANLRAAEKLSPEALRCLSLPELASLIRPSGYFNAKARKLQAFVEWLGDYYHDDLARMFATKAEELRQQLLSVYGIGEETADSILLYAANKPIFVIDAYTRRIIDRLGLTPNGNNYAAYQALFMDNLPADAELFNEYHALFVYLGKNICRTRPLCGQCCLKRSCPSAEKRERERKP